MAHPIALLPNIGTMEPRLVNRQLSDISRMLVIIDPSVANYRELAAGALDTADVVVLRDDVDAIAQITDILRGAPQTINSLHIITHGTSGCLRFSCGELSLATFAQYSVDLAKWVEMLAPQSSLLLYGCNIADGKAGENFIQQLYNFLEMPIAASPSPVGHSALQGSWQLPYQVGEPRFVVPFHQHTLAAYDSVLMTSVIDISPSLHDTNALLNDDLVITFDAAINPATVSSDSIKVSGSSTGELAGTFSTAGRQVTFNPTGDFNPGEQIQVAVTSAVQSTTATPVNAYVGDFLAAATSGSGDFVASGSDPSTNADGSNDIALADFDGDGDLDAFVANFGQASQVLENNGSGEFTTVANPGLTSTHNSYDVEIADLDDDGDLDAFVANFSNQFNEVLLNNGSGVFSLATSQPAGTASSTSVSLGDLNGDGYVDAFVTNFGSNEVLLNDGTGVFSATAQTPGGNLSFGSTLGDLNGDGALDIFVVNISAPNEVLLNDGTGTAFTQAAVQPPGSSQYTDVSLGDLDSDGDLDAFVTDNAGANQVLINDGSGGFTLATNQPPSNSSSAAINLADLDGDGDLDAFVSTLGAGTNQILLNDGSSQFTTAPNQLPHNGETTLGAGSGDLNGDGSLDIFIANEDTVNQIFFNTVASNAAPSFSGDAVLASISEGDANPSGAAVSTLFSGLFQDADSGSSRIGVAVVTNTASTSTQGVWQYSLDGASWRTITGDVDDDAALILSDSTQVRFLPNISYNGMPTSLGVRALDDTYSGGFSTAVADAIVDVSANGGSSAVSSSIHAISTTVAPIANVIFVNQNATGTGDGGSWINAFTDLQSALALASDGDDIWLAQGTYTPGATREATFSLTNEIAIYGGFLGTEASRSGRDFEVNLTLLSGEIGAADNSDNSYHVVTGNSTAGAIIDGVIIQDGNTQGAATDDDDDGAGVYNKAKLTLENVVVKNNVAADDGGGIRNDGDLTLINSTVADNTALSSSSSTSGGGGLLNTVGSSATLINSTFSGNQAKAGGAIRNDAQLTLVNTTLSGNIASESGGGLMNTTTDSLNGSAPAGTVVLVNSTITNNEGKNTSGNNFNGAGVANFGSLTATNSIIAGNNNDDDIRNHFAGTSISQGHNFIGNGSNASGFTNGSNNDQVGSDTTPLDPLLGSLQNNGGFTQTHAPDGSSLVIDSGNNSSIAIDSVDLDSDGDITETVPFGQRGSGFNRVVNGTVDIGAVESTTGANTAPLLTGDGVLASVDENSTDPVGDTVANLLTAQFSDPDVGAALSGVAVVGNASGVEGAWQYSTDGATWREVATVADDGTALALSVDTLVRFLPAADFSGDAPVLTVRALDDTYSDGFTSGTTRQTVDTTNNGGRSAIAQSTNNIATSITAVNNAPVLSVSGLQLSAVDEDAAAPVGPVGTLVSDLVDSASTAGGLDNVADIDADALVGIAVTTADTANGAWFYSVDDGANWLSLGAVGVANARLLAEDDRVYFQPTADFNGSIPNAIRFQAWDQSAGTNGDLVDVAVNGGITAFSTAVESADITVNPVNDAPTVVLQNVLSSLAEDVDTTAWTKVADIVVGDIDAGVNTLSLAGENAALFEIDGTELFLTAGVSLDFEAIAQLDVSVEVDDSSVGTAPDDTATLSLSIGDVNEAPSAIALESAVTTLAEDADASTPRKLADIVVVDDALGANSLSVLGTDAASFEVVGTELFLKAGISLDFEGQQQYNITVQVDDVGVGTPSDATVDFSLEITDVNEAPTSVILLNTTTALDETLDTTTRVKVADINVVDDALGTNTLIVAGDDAAAFEILGSELFLKAGTALDFETKSQYDILVQVDDASVGGTPDASVPFSLTVGDVNEAPSAITLNNTTPSLNENIDTTSALSVADIAIVDDVDVANNVLSLSGTDAANFEIVGTELRLKAGTSLDFETQSQYDVTVQVDDATVGGAPDATQDFTLMVTDVNEAPTALSLQNEQVSFAENVDTTARVKVADIVITDDALGSNSLTVTGTDAAAFEVVGTELFIKAGTALDLETQIQYDVTVQVDDTAVGNTPDATVDFSLRVTDVNEAPTAVTLQNVVAALAENSNTTGRVKLADIVVTDDAIGSNALSITGADAALFEIVGNELFLKADTSLDSESQNQYDITVQVDDLGVGASPDASVAFSLAVTDVNEAPTAVTFANAIGAVDENTDTTSRLKVADINIADDSIGVNTLGLAGTDASSFEIVGTELFLAAGSTLDFEAKSQYDIVVEVDDTTVGDSPDVLANFGLAVTNVNEAPNTLSLQNPVVSLAETADTTNRTKLADIAFLDDALGSNMLSVAGSDAGLFEIDGNELFLRAGSTLDFESQSQYDVTVSVDDATVGSSPDEMVAYSLSLTDVNEAPFAVSLRNVVSELDENADTSSRIKVADIGITDDALGNNDLSLAGTDASRFELDGDELFLTAGATLNFEAQEQLDVSVVVDDATVGVDVDARSALTINITDANEAPGAVSLQNVTNTLNENSSTGTQVKVADIVVADDALGTNALSLSGDDATDFEIVGNELFLRAGTVLDFEAKAGFDVSVVVDDAAVGNSPDARVDFRLEVTDLNEAPSAVTLQNAVTIIAENVNTASGVKLADIVIADDALGNNDLTLVGTDASDFEIFDGALFLKAGTSLNQVRQSQYDVTVQVDDASVGNSPDAMVDLSLEVTETNDAPTAIEVQNAVATLAEDTSTTTRTALGDLVITDDPVGFNNLTVTGADAEFFEIEAGQLYLKSGVTLDFETQPVYDIEIAVDDATIGASPDAVTSFSLAISDVNEAPSAIAFSNALTTLAENADTTTQRKVADIVVIDDVLGTNVLSLSGADAADFLLVGRELFLQAGTSLDFENKSQYDVSVVVDDAAIGAGLDAAADFSLSITDINEVPVGVTLDNVTTTLAENISTNSRTKVADIVIADDALGDNTLVVTGNDANSFELEGAELFLKRSISLDHESQSQYDITVVVDDATVGASPDATVDYSLVISDVNEAPSAVTLQTVTTSLAENLNVAVPVKVADISVADDALGSQSLTLGGADAGEFSIVGSELFLNAGTPLNFEENARYDVVVQVDDPAVGSDIDASADFSLAVEDVNEAPTGLSLPRATAAIAENIDTTNRVKLTDLLITDDALGTNDLVVVGADASTFEIVGNELFVRAGTTLDKATQDQYAVTVQVNDASFGVGPNATATFDLSIAETNDAPTSVALQNALLSIAENIDTQSPVKVADIVVTDDPVGINGLTVVGADASLFEIVGTELFLKAGVSVDFESQTQYDVAIQVDDVSIGDSPDAVVDFSLTVTDVNEAPTLLANMLTIVQGDTVVLSRENLAASDVDNSVDQLIYTVSALSGGQFEQVSDSFVVTTFSQAQIDGGEIQFVHDDSDNAPSYAVSVSDGELITAPQSVTIGRFIRPGDGPINVVPTAQDTDENEAIVFSSAEGNQLAVENLGSANDLAVTLSVDNGVLTLGDLDALSFLVGDGREDRTLEFVGAIADVNSALNGLVLTPDRGYTGNINLQIVSEDQGLGEAFADSDTVSIEVAPGEIPNALNAADNNLVSVSGGSGGSQLRLSLENVASNQVNEVIVVETDEQGRIDGLAPGDAGYIDAVIAQGQVVLSTLASGFDGLDIERTLDVIGNVSLQFAVIQGGSLDGLQRGEVHNIRLATPVPNDSTFNRSGSGLQVEQLSDRSLQLGFEIEGRTGFDDIILSAVLADASTPIGSNLQGDTESELIDLRGIVGPVTATFEVYREADFDNVVGFFTVENAAGQVLDAQGNLLNVGDAGYVDAAIARRVAVELTTENGQVSTYSAEVAGGQLLASYIISDGSVDSLLDSDTSNDSSVFFTHIGANSDRSDHTRLLGDNTFGFEDMVGGGDQDFDDVVVKVSLS